MHQFDDVNFNADEENFQSVPKNVNAGQKEAKDDEDDYAEVTLLIDDIISPEERERNKQRPRVLKFVLGLWGFTMVAPIAAPVFLPEMQEPTPIQKEIIFQTQAFMTAIVAPCILLYYFPNPQLLAALERVAKEFIKQSRK